MSIGSRVEEAREERGWTQTRLAQECGLTGPGISQIEADGREPRAGTLRKIAVALGKSMDWLCEVGETSEDRREAIRLLSVDLSQAKDAVTVRLPPIVPKGSIVRWGREPHAMQGVAVNYESEFALVVRLPESGPTITLDARRLISIEPPK